jgi:hypothetical protein
MISTARQSFNLHNHNATLQNGNYHANGGLSKGNG